MAYSCVLWTLNILWSIITWYWTKYDSEKARILFKLWTLQKSNILSSGRAVGCLLLIFWIHFTARYREYCTKLYLLYCLEWNLLFWRIYVFSLISEQQSPLSNLINSSPPSAAYIHQWTGSALVKVMACHLYGTKPYVDLLSIVPLGTNISEIWIGIQSFSFMKMHLRMLSVKWQPFC